uniref:Uncharacterized protein n=1 Tax=Anguilla anguilla TaxID=7936 RepID=A0A0E9V1Y2_ANGAN
MVFNGVAKPMIRPSRTKIQY